MSYDINEIEQRYSYINEQNTVFACNVFGEVCLELSHKTKTNFPPSNINNLSPKILELAKKFNKRGFLSSLIESGQLSLPVEQKAVLQVLERMNINYELYLDKKKEALQNTINEQKALAQELMEMSEKGHKQLIEMLIDLEEFFAKYYKLDKLRQEIKDLEKELEFIREQLQEITRTLKEIAEELAINEEGLSTTRNDRSNTINELLKLELQLKLQLQHIENNQKQQYKELNENLDPVLLSQFINNIIDRTKNLSQKAEKDFQQKFQAPFDHKLTLIETQQASAVLISNTTDKSIAKSKNELVILVEQRELMKQDPEQSQEKIASITEEIADLEKQITEDEEKKDNLEEQISEYTSQKTDIASKLKDFEKLLESLKSSKESLEFIETSKKINILKEKDAFLTNKENELEKKKIKLIEQIKPLEQQKEELEQQQKALTKKKEIKQKIVKD